MEFQEFPKMARLSRDVIITEKIDGTNGCVCIGEDGEFLVGSRSRWITPQDDNYGFAAWAYEHKDELMKLGPGRHFGEWWGRGIQRNYSLTERRWSLFNVSRWCLASAEPQIIPSDNPRAETKYQERLPACCSLVPVLYRGTFDTNRLRGLLIELQKNGSVAAPGFMKPEGVVIFHTAANIGFKKTLEKDEMPKSLAEKVAA